MYVHVCHMSCTCAHSYYVNAQMNCWEQEGLFSYFRDQETTRDCTPQVWYVYYTRTLFLFFYFRGGRRATLQLERQKNVSFFIFQMIFHTLLY